MNLDNLYPYLTCGGYQKDNTIWVFLTPYGEVEIKNANQVISCLIPLCNGELKLAEVIVKIEDQNKDKKDIKDFVLKLFKLGILSDKFQVYKTWKVHGENPMIFFSDKSESEISDLIKSELPKDKATQINKIEIPDFILRNILNSRSSTREFSTESLTAGDIIGLFWSSYGVQKNREKVWKYGKEKTLTVPSGGGLYPLVLYLIQLKDTQDLLRGIYRWNSEALEFERLINQGHLENLESVITGIDSLKNATGIMIVTADYQRVSEKYANKAYPLVLLEAGHVMQNAYLYCAEQEIGFVEVLGFEQEGLSKSLELNDKFDLVVIGIFGTKEVKNDKVKRQG
ncbi:MAG: SagB/ThcOx family dehydrogenase [Patescibacteria group bacterium]